MFEELAEEEEEDDDDDDPEVKSLQPVRKTRPTSENGSLKFFQGEVKLGIMINEPGMLGVVNHICRGVKLHAECKHTHTNDMFLKLKSGRLTELR